MSTNVSPAARELAEKLWNAGYSVEVEGYAQLIQSAVNELVEKARKASERLLDNGWTLGDDLIEVLSPWISDGQEGSNETPRK